MTEDGLIPPDGKKKKRGDVPEDKSTPNASDRGLFNWMLGLFQEDERADWIVATKVFGRLGRTVGNVVLRKDIKRETNINPEYIVSLSNEFLEAMQNETDAFRKTMSFEISAHHHKRGAEPIATRSVTLDPKKVHLRENGQGDDDEDGALPNGGDLLRKRVETVLQDGRFYAEHVTTSLGGMVQLMLEQLRDKDRMIKELFDANMSLARQKNEAENNALDRDLARKDKELAIEMKRKGMNLLAGLLPDAVKKVTGGTVQIPGGRSSESLAIESVMESLTPAERSFVFGDWSEAGQRLRAGVLSETQVRILVGVLKDEESPDKLKHLLTGSEAVTAPQFAQITGFVDADKFIPLFSLLNDLKAQIAAQNGANGSAAKP